MADLDKNAPREIILSQATNLPDHIWGVEREPALVTALITITLIVLSFDFWVTVFAVSLWIIVFNGLRMMAKADPYMSRVYIRHVKYKAHYPARSTPFATTTKQFKGWR